MTDISSIQMELSTTTFSSITSYGMGGVIKANSLGSLYMTDVTVTTVTISTGYNSAYEGSFLYMSNTDSNPITISITDSSITCKASFSDFSLSPSILDYYSVFYVTKSN
jgi:hypothetical protein